MACTPADPETTEIGGLTLPIRPSLSQTSVLLCCKPDGRSNGACYVDFGSAEAAGLLLAARSYAPLARRNVIVVPVSVDEVQLAMALRILVGLRVSKPWDLTVLCRGPLAVDGPAVAAVAAEHGEVSSYVPIWLPGDTDAATE